jgi:glycosyltransferase involved in cell wall biosynthesis
MRVLDDQGFARRIAEEASRKVRNAYSWGAIAERTERFYEGILAEYRAGPWKPHPITK